MRKQCSICGSTEHIGLFKCPVAKERLSAVTEPIYDLSKHPNFSLFTADPDDPVIDAKIMAYIEKLTFEKESLVARYLQETGLKISEICLVERENEMGFIIYPDRKSNYEFPEVKE